MNVPAPLALSMPQRDVAIERLSRAFAEDAITMDEFEHRAELVYRAVTAADLQTLVADLPAASEPAGGGAGRGKPVVATATGDRIRTVLGSTERRMPAQVPRYLSVSTLLGSTELDFRSSVFEPGITEVHVRCLLGNVEITVPAGVRVEMLVSGVLANVEVTRDGGAENLEAEAASGRLVGNSGAGADGAPPNAVLRILGRAVLANVELHR